LEAKLTRLIITTSDSGAGCLKAAHIAERVVGLHYQLVHGPAPITDAPLDFFDARTELLSENVEEWKLELLRSLPEALRQVERDGAEFDRIELWVDPTPNGQLILFQLIDWLRHNTTIADRLFLVQAELTIGSQSPETIARWSPEFRHINETVSQLAAAVWHAYRRPSPEAWCNLLNEDLATIPKLAATVQRLLLELPDIDSGLMETQREILSLVGRGCTQPQKVLAQPTLQAKLAVFDYWETGDLLTELGHCQTPALYGVTEPRFTLAMHDDEERRNRFRKSSIGLTDFGQRLLEKREDFAQHNTIDRWWGGTHLTNEQLWRWDPISRSVAVLD
jgi:hypothetical protein